MYLDSLLLRRSMDMILMYFIIHPNIEWVVLFLWWNQYPCRLISQLCNIFHWQCQTSSQTFLSSVEVEMSNDHRSLKSINTNYHGYRLVKSVIHLSVILMNTNQTVNFFESRMMTVTSLLSCWLLKGHIVISVGSLTVNVVRAGRGMSAAFIHD